MCVHVLGEKERGFVLKPLCLLYRSNTLNAFNIHMYLCVYTITMCGA